MTTHPLAHPPVGWGGRHAVELYVRTYSTMLQSSGEIRVRALEPAHMAMGSALHSQAADPQVDMGALLYSARRLPTIVSSCRRVVMGQSVQDFRSLLGVDIRKWTQVAAPARRRRWYHDGAGTLAVMIASPSDVDDLVPTLVAYQIEWNKLHRALAEADPDPEQARMAAGAGEDDWRRLEETWGPDFEATLRSAWSSELELWLRMIGGTNVGFARSADRWWQPVAKAIKEMDLETAPIYFVSSNLHSLVNVLSGVARSLEKDIHDFIGQEEPSLIEEYRRLAQGQSLGSVDNWLYFGARYLFESHLHAERYRRLRLEMEGTSGIRHIRAGDGVDSGVQIFKLSQLDPASFDPRIGTVDATRLRNSPAAIVNINYPLGLAAYNLLRQVAVHAGEVAGIYVMGKAATLNGDVGDVLIPNVVFNEHSDNTYWLDNCFSAADVQPHLVFGSALDNQRAVTVRGTFLQNREYLEFYYRGRFTVVEMEAGPYLDAAFETSQPGRHPVGENVNMSRPGFDLGIIHYASDTPYTQARTLGARGLSYRGMDSTYASAVAVARRILRREGAL